MTPIQLLSDVKDRFSILLIDDDKILISLLKKALLLYQDRAGFIGRYRYESGCDTYLLPPDFLARIAVTDNDNKFIQSTPLLERNEIELKLNGSESFPLTLIFMQNVLNIDLATWQLPNNAYGLIADYLELLITISNSERLRRVSTAGKLDTSDIPLNSDLLTRKSELELAIAENRAIIPVMSI